MVRKCRLLVTLLLFCLLLSGFRQNRQNTIKHDTVGYIFIGDSRTVGMDMCLHFADSSKHTYMVAKESKGYDWLMKQGLDQIAEIRKKDSDVDRWEYVVNLGVNDPANVDKYIKWAESVDDAKVYYISVNPLDNDKKDESVISFNEKLRDSGLEYIDTYYYLCHIGYESSDGVHYGKNTYREIYEFICAEIGKTA